MSSEGGDVMQQTPFHAYYAARKLESYVGDASLVPAFASSNIEIYPYQIAAAQFALRSPYLKGCVLCDEGSLGKTFEAMLIATQKWYEGQTKQLIILPINIINQWIAKIETSFNIPYVLIDNEKTFSAYGESFEQDAIVIISYDFAVEKAEHINRLLWDLVIFDEADRLNKAHTGESKTAITLKSAVYDSFKILLTPTPITKDIMDIYGLIYFIDETVLPDKDEFYKRYFRQPENYPELTNLVSKFCFRTLKSQVTDYVTFSNRIPYVVNYDLTKEESEIHTLLKDTYLMFPKRYAYPKLEPYRLGISTLYPTFSSSPQAFINTLDTALERLAETQVNESEQGYALAEMKLLTDIKELAETIQINGKSKELLSVLKKAFAYLRQMKLTQKAIIFVNYVVTQDILYKLLSDKGYSVLKYNGAAVRDYEILEQFRTDKNAQILIATDQAAKGLDFEFCPLVINYDSNYNALLLEQRINRCHRQGQKSDVLVVNLIGKDNMADVRALELINKRVLQFEGIFGMSDAILGNFDKDMDEVLSSIRPQDEVMQSFEKTLSENEQDNRHLVANTEDTLFTTFSKEVADKVTIEPKYISEKADEINNSLWNVITWFFADYNKGHTDCYFDIDERQKTITAQDYQELPHLFYYYTGGQNKPYKSLKNFGMAKDFKPHYGKITLASVISRGIIDSLECANEGSVIVDADIEPCTIGLYSVEIKSKNSKRQSEYSVFVGKTSSGKVLSDAECQSIMELPILQYTEGEHKTAHWLKSTSSRLHELDRLVNTDELIQKYVLDKNSAQTEEVEHMKLRAAKENATLDHFLDDVKTEIKITEAELDNITIRIKRMTFEKKLTALRQELKKKEELQFLDEIKIDTELEKRIAEFLEKEKPTASLIRQFVIKVEGNA